MKTIVGNWKMNVGTRESVALARGVLLALRGKKRLPEVALCPPFTALGEVRKVVARSHASLGAQNVAAEEQGAFTGEISTRMLVELGVTHVIVGHSERRHLFGETDASVNQKVIRTLSAGMVPIVCVGEGAADRAAGKERDVVAAQLRGALADLHLRHKERILFAYEPVWAIGSGTSDTPADAVAMHAWIRSLVPELLPGIKPEQVAVLYGGSIDGSNAYLFLREDEVDGLLVGGASVKLSEFTKILDAAADVLDARAA
ncbi:triose-phosphate isomerase [Candidatus Uhrbacteria bacterium RIFOXYC12_FULL_57_11]|nr:MAG: triose-phosphate isomerase [Candidatus Uhrbacteria bacterium RIFOXYC12_FULL_57_11]